MVSREDMSEKRRLRQKASDVTDNREDIARPSVHVRTIIKRDETSVHSTRLRTRSFVLVPVRVCIVLFVTDIDAYACAEGYGGSRPSYSS